MGNLYFFPQKESLENRNAGVDDFYLKTKCVKCLQILVYFDFNNYNFLALINFVIIFLQLKI